MVVDDVQKHHSIDELQRPLLPLFDHGKNLISDTRYCLRQKYPGCRTRYCQLLCPWDTWPGSFPQYPGRCGSVFSALGTQISTCGREAPKLLRLLNWFKGFCCCDRCAYCVHPCCYRRTRITKILKLSNSLLK